MNGRYGYIAVTDATYSPLDEGTTMNFGQKIVLATTMIVAVVIGCVPPWKYTTDFTTGTAAGSRISGHSEKPADYHALWNPPPVEHNSYVDDEVGMGVAVDTTRIAIQYVALMTVAISLFALLGTMKNQTRGKESYATQPVPTDSVRFDRPSDAGGLQLDQKHALSSLKTDLDAIFRSSSRPSIKEKKTSRLRWWQFSPMGYRIAPLQWFAVVLVTAILAAGKWVLSQYTNLGSLTGSFVAYFLWVWVVAALIAVIAWRCAKRSQSAFDIGFRVGIFLSAVHIFYADIHSGLMPVAIAQHSSIPFTYPHLTPKPFNNRAVPVDDLPDQVVASTAASSNVHVPEGKNVWDQAQNDLYSGKNAVALALAPNPHRDIFDEVAEFDQAQKTAHIYLAITNQLAEARPKPKAVAVVIGGQTVNVPAPPTTLVATAPNTPISRKSQTFSQLERHFEKTIFSGGLSQQTWARLRANPAGHEIDEASYAFIQSQGWLPQ